MTGTDSTEATTGRREQEGWKKWSILLEMRLHRWKWLREKQKQRRLQLIRLLRKPKLLRQVDITFASFTGAIVII